MKPNLTFSSHLPGIITSPRVIEAVIAALKERTSNITVSESNGGYQGCSMIFNKRLCIMAARYRADYCFLHDDVVSLLAHCFGRVYFLPKKLMLWRQHESNVTGNLLDIRSYLKRALNRNLCVLSKTHYIEKESFYNEYKNDLDCDARRLFEAYLDFPQKLLLKRIILITQNGFSVGGNRQKLLIKTIIRRPIG